MSSNVVLLPVVTRLPMPPKRVLEQALKNHREDPFQRVLVIGVTETDEYYAFSEPDGGTALWDMERCRHKLMQVVDNE